MNGNQSKSIDIQTGHRNTNLELFRIISMLFIVAHHYVVNSGMMTHMVKDLLAPNSLFFFIFGAWGKTGINCFVLITGYFMCKSHITLRKFLKLIFQIEFYNIVIFCIFVLTGYSMSDGTLLNISDKDQKWLGLKDTFVF